MKTSARSLIYLREVRGLAHVGLVERHTAAFRPKSEGGGAIPGGRRHDLFGFIDIVAIDEHPGLLGVQACGSSDLTEHMRKIDELPAAVAFLGHGNRLEIHGWRKVRLKRGGVAMRWRPRILDAEVAGGAISWHEREEESSRSAPCTRCGGSGVRSSPYMGPEIVSVSPCACRKEAEDRG